MLEGRIRLHQANGVNEPGAASAQFLDVWLQEMLSRAYARSLRRLTTRCRFRSSTPAATITIPASTAWDEYISSLYAPYDPSPFLVMETAFAAVSLSSSDVLLDLGAGDGRVVEAAAARCVRA